jgi:hypothetical protein
MCDQPSQHGNALFGACKDLLVDDNSRSIAALMLSSIPPLPLSLLASISDGIEV